MWKALKDEFQISKFGFSGVERSKFYSTTFSKVPRWFRLVTQGISMTYLVTMTIVSNFHSLTLDHKREWWVFMTSWNYVLCTLFFITSFFVYLIYGRQWENLTDATTDHEFLSIAPTDHELLFIETFYWLLFSITHGLCLFVVPGFWVLRYPGVKEHYKDYPPFHFYNSVDRHAVVYGILLFEYMFHEIPVRILHVVYPWSIGLVFFLFSCIWYHTTKRHIYENIFDWSKPGKSVLALVILTIVAVMLQVILFLIDQLKHHIARKQISLNVPNV